MFLNFDSVYSMHIMKTVVYDKEHDNLLFQNKHNNRLNRAVQHKTSLKEEQIT